MTRQYLIGELSVRREQLRGPPYRGPMCRRSGDSRPASLLHGHAERRGADRTGRYWPITIGGYILQMSVVPLLAIAGNWQVAALLIIAERIGKGIRNPPRDAMLSHAAKDIGYGRAFGLHDALDQFGALFGPLLVALILVLNHHDYKIAFAALAVPAAIMLSLLAVARLLYPRPQDLAPGPAPVTTQRGPTPIAAWSSAT